jgi:Putative zincin peptidase
MTIKKSASRRKIPDAETLEKEPGFKKILELDFDEMIPFVLSNIRKKSLFPLLYLIFNAASLIFIIFVIGFGLNAGLLNAGKILGQIVAGIVVGSILVIPPHELLHGLAYRILGARKIRFGIDLKQFIFYVTADRFPISRKELVFLALTPFVVINMVIIGFTVLWVQEYILFMVSLLLSHNIMCIGDFAMVGYACSLHNEMITYDDPQNKRSYFYEKCGESL